MHVLVACVSKAESVKRFNIMCLQFLLGPFLDVGFVSNECCEDWSATTHGYLAAFDKLFVANHRDP